ncbi:MAG TPA: DUF5947 family protein [Rhizomicrobium sp.]|jgi:hypothetical protein|nr:DUF5947 family protein [Rhizomicrobium sp.]
MQAGGSSQTVGALKAIFSLRRFVYPPVERCELCRASLSGKHDHLLEIAAGQMRCACKSCAQSYGTAEEGFLPIASRKQRLSQFALSDAEWDGFQIPIDLAFLVRKGERLTALYPGPAGIVQSEPDPSAWQSLLAANPVLNELQPEVEALVVNRVQGRREAYRLSIDHCFTLAGTMRSQWHGLSGGPKVWDEIARYFDIIGAGDHA